MRAATEPLVDHGCCPDFGARPLRRAPGTSIEDPLSEQLLSGARHGKNRIVIDQTEGENEPLFKATFVEPPADENETEVAARST